MSRTGKRLKTMIRILTFQKDDEMRIDMRKNIHTYYIFLGLILAAVSCSHDDVEIGNGITEGGRIEFKVSLPEVATRATQVTSSTLESFQVSCFTESGTSNDISYTPYFLDKSFKKKSPSETDASKIFFASNDPACIWPNNNQLRFVAFSPSCEQMRQAGDQVNFTLPSITLGEQMTDGAFDYNLDNFKIASDIRSQFDFITAIASGNLKDNEETGISLNFQHQLSRIEIKAWGNSKSYDLEIAGVCIGGVGTGGVFNFTPNTSSTDATRAGSWTSVSKGSVEYICNVGDRTITIDSTNGTPSTADQAVSIMGAKIGGTDEYDNSAMVIPSDNTSWDYKDHANNGDNHSDGMYFSVLLRVIDRTPENNNKQQYPYTDNRKEPDALNIPKVFLAVDKDGIITDNPGQLYKDDDGKYYTDSAMKTEYNAPQESEVKEFGWAALPIADNLQPGRVYTYTLNYTNGVGLRDPADPYNPGEPVISDNVIVNAEVTEWVEGKKSSVDVPRK